MDGFGEEFDSVKGGRGGRKEGIKEERREEGPGTDIMRSQAKAMHQMIERRC